MNWRIKHFEESIKIEEESKEKTMMTMPYIQYLKTLIRMLKFGEEGI